MREKIHYLKFCMSCSAGQAGQAGHPASPLVMPFVFRYISYIIVRLCDA